MSTAKNILDDWKKGKYGPVYWLEGEESYFIDKVVDHAEHHILSESESSFNLSVFYGKDASWADVLNACRRYPMFAERQVVLLKEAQQMRDIDKLEAYIANPLGSTIFVVSYKDKKVDGRSKLAKLLKEKAVMLSTKKLYDRDIPGWTQEMIQSKGLSITPRGLALLVDHIGNDLTRIENEVDKLSVNLGKRTSITEDDIENFIGVSKEFNVFELQSALGARDLSRCLRIIQYFAANPKASPIQMVLPSLYSYFSKIFIVLGAGTSDEKTLAALIGVPPFFMKDYTQAARNYSYPEVEKVLLLLHQYNLKSVGVGDTGSEDASLLKELAVKILA